MDGATIDRKQSRQLLIAIVLLVLFALLVRLWGIDARSYWFDEAREVLRALTPWPDVLLVTDGADPPVYRLLLFPIASLTTHEFWLRLPSALFSAGTVLLAFWWLRMLGEPLLGLIVGGFLAVSASQIYYAQEVSQYSLVVFLAVALLVVFERAGRNGRWQDWLLLTGVSLIAIYTYYGLAWLFPVLDLQLAWRTWRQRHRPPLRPRIRGFLAFHAAIVVGVAALYALMLSTHINRFQTNKGLTAPFLEQGILAPLRTIDERFLTEFVEFFTIPFSPTAPDVIGYGVLALVLAGSAALLWHSAAGRHIVITFWSVVAVMFVANGLGLYPFGNRYAFAVLPLFFTLIAGLVLWLRRWPPTAVSLAALFILLQMAFWPHLGSLVGNPWLALPEEELRPAVAYLNAQAQPDDVVYVYYGAVPAYQVYQQDAAVQAEMGIWFREWTTAEKAAEIRDVVAQRERFWFVATHIHQQEADEIAAELTTAVPRYAIVDEFRATNAVVILLERQE